MRIYLAALALALPTILSDQSVDLVHTRSVIFNSYTVKMRTVSLGECGLLGRNAVATVVQSGRNKRGKSVSKVGCAYRVNDHQ